MRVARYDVAVTSSILNQSTELVEVGRLKRHPRNPRVGNLDAIRESIRVNGFWGALVVQRSTDYVLAGNHRLEAAKAEGFTEVPVVFVDVNDEVALRILLADNRTSDLGVYDDRALVALLEELKVTSTSLAGLGYSEDDLSDLLAKLQKEDAKKWGERKDSVAEKVQSRTQPGDIWLMGPHRLMCGDSTDSAQVKHLMNGETASLFHTDPPYGVAYSGERKGSVGDSGKDWSNVFHEIPVSEYLQFTQGWIDAAMPHLAKNAAWYAWLGYAWMGPTLNIWEQRGVLCHQMVVWAKPAPMFSMSFFNWQHEQAIFGWQKGNIPEGRGSPEAATRTTLWTLTYDNGMKKQQTDHPTQKPVELFAIPMRVHTKLGDICYEPFSGSGSQLIAAESEGRVCYAMEKQPQFVDVAVARWENLTGQQATVMRSGA